MLKPCEGVVRAANLCRRVAVQCDFVGPFTFRSPDALN